MSGGGVTENDDYKIADDAINLRKDGVVYELTGTTDRKIQIWGSNSPDPVKTFYLRLNNATVNGGISITNPNGAKLVIEVVDGTTNTVERIYAVDLSISGKGTLNASDLGTTQQDNNDSRHLTSALFIKDATINVNTTTNNPSEWNGVCVLDGQADVTYTTNTEYAALVLGQTSKFSHSLTMKGNSKLRCLHSNADEPSQSSVSGLEGFNGATITLQDNAYLEAQGRACSGEYAGYGVVCDGDIVVKGNATLKATAQDVAVCTSNNLEVFGGTLIAKSTGSNGVYAGGAISISNAEAEVLGFYPALYAVSDATVEGSSLTATSTGRAAIYSENGVVSLTKSMVDANGADGYYGIYASGGVNVSGSWVETTGPESLDNVLSSIESSVLFNGKDGKVIGDASLPKDATIAADMALDIPEGMSLTVPEGKTLINHGKVFVEGELNRLATILWRNACPDEAAAYDPATAKDATGIAGSADGQFYTAAANWAVANKVITGIVREDGSLDFAATEDVTFEQLVTILARVGATPEEVAAAGTDLTAFVDGDAASAWSAPSLKWAADEGLVQGYDEPAGKRLAPGEDVAREREATVLMRAFELGILK